MEREISKNILKYIKEAFPKLLETEGDVFLNKPFNGFFISFNPDSQGSLINNYSAEEIGQDKETRKIYLFCKDIFGK